MSDVIYIKMQLIKRQERQFQPSIAFHIETSHLIDIAK